MRCSQPSAHVGHHAPLPAPPAPPPISLPDAEVNTGEISDTGLLARIKANAADGIHTTVVGAAAAGALGVAGRGRDGASSDQPNNPSPPKSAHPLLHPHPTPTPTPKKKKKKTSPTRI